LTGESISLHFDEIMMVKVIEVRILLSISNINCSLSVKGSGTVKLIYNKMGFVDKNKLHAWEDSALRMTFRGAGISRIGVSNIRYVL
jgi:hypothetical protein